MDTVSLKATIVSGRDIAIAFGDFLSKLLPFEGSKIAGLIILVLSFILVSWIVNSFSPKNNIIPKLIGTGALFYFLWLW